MPSDINNFYNYCSNNSNQLFRIGGITRVGTYTTIGIYTYSKGNIEGSSAYDEWCAGGTFYSAGLKRTNSQTTYKAFSSF